MHTLCSFSYPLLWVRRHEYQQDQAFSAGIDDTMIDPRWAVNSGTRIAFGLIVANQRYMGTDKRVGFEQFMFNKAAVHFDSHILTTGGNFTLQRAYILNTNWLRFNIGEGRNFVMEDKTPTNADGYVAEIKLYCQLSCNARRFQASVDNFTVT